jgi:simple sugar transport system permease protein
MTKDLVKIQDKLAPLASSVLPSLAAIAVGMVVGLFILIISNPAHAWGGFLEILFAGSNSLRNMGRVLYFATPIILTGLSVGFAFKTGLFNIGASGQFIMGAYCAVLVGVLGTSLGSLHWIVALLAALVGGALWALVPGLLKAYANVNEVISSIMMNYIGMNLVNYLVVLTVFNPTRNESMPVARSAEVPHMGMRTLFSGSNVNGGILIAVAVVIVMWIILNKTTFGFELKAVGFNRHASRYAGINEKRSIVYSMVIAGALAGLGGGLLYLAGTGKHIEVVDVLAAEGFQGIPVALLGMSNPIAILFSAIFIAYISVGGNMLQRHGFVPEIINIIIAAIIYCSAFALVIKNFLEYRRAKAGGGKAA